jgi:hypothetical protein
VKRRVSASLAVILGVGVVLTVAAGLLRAIIEVRHNRGAEIYVNAKGMQVHWVDDLTKWAAVLLTTFVFLVAIAVYKWRQKRDAARVNELEARISGETPAEDE